MNTVICKVTTLKYYCSHIGNRVHQILAGQHQLFLGFLNRKKMVRMGTELLRTIKLIFNILSIFQACLEMHRITRQSVKKYFILYLIFGNSLNILKLVYVPYFILHTDPKVSIWQDIYKYTKNDEHFSEQTNRWRNTFARDAPYL